MDEQVQSIDQLLGPAREFDLNALTQIYDSCSSELYRYAIRRLNDPATAEECVAETFSRFLQALRDRRGPNKFVRAYLYRIAHNWIINLYRQAPKSEDELSEEHPDEHNNPETLSGAHQSKAGLQEAIRSLTPDQQQVIILRYMEGWEHEEIARSLKKPVGAIKSLQHRALASLQKRLCREEL